MNDIINNICKNYVTDTNDFILSSNDSIEAVYDVQEVGLDFKIIF